MTHYLKNDFVSQYCNYLRNPAVENNPYRDPDTMNEKYSVFDPEKEAYENRRFYQDLAKFMNRREETLKFNERFFYEVPTEEGGFVYIIVKDCFGNEIMKLTSDQLSFSAWQERMIGSYFSESYPLHRCFEYAQQLRTPEEKEDIHKFMAQYVYDTRTLGGSFIFPKIWDDKKNSYTCNYNYFRGAGSYIEDSVDFTLLEIKHFYDNLGKTKGDISYEDSTEEDILYKECENNESKMKRYLMHFESFEKYVSFFMLESFVGINKDYPFSEIFPINIFTKDIETNVETLEAFVDKKKRIENVKDIKEIMNMLENVRRMVIKRSEEIESI